MDEGVKLLAVLLLKEGWNVTGHGYKIYPNGRRLYVKLQHEEMADHTNIVEVGPRQRVPWTNNIFDGIEEV